MFKQSCNEMTQTENLSTLTSTPEKSTEESEDDISSTFSRQDPSNDECKSQDSLTTCRNMLKHLNDQPVNWNSIDLVMKTDLYTTVLKNVTNYVNPDIFIRIGDHHFNCHLIVLNSYTQFFNDCGFGMTVYLPPDKVPVESFPIIYDWMLQYSDMEETFLTRRNILDIIGAANYLGILELEEQCWAFIDSLDVFNEETAFLMYLQAMARENTTVMELMLPRISWYFLPLVNLNDFCELSHNVICALLKSNFISVHNEMEIFMAAVKWLTYDWSNRHKYVKDVMACVRFGFMEPHQLVQLLRSQRDYDVRMVTQTPEVTDLIKQAAEYAVVRFTFGHSQQEFKEQMQSLRLNPPEQRNWISHDNKCTLLQRVMQELSQGDFRNTQLEIANILSTECPKMQAAVTDEKIKHSCHNTTTDDECGTTCVNDRFHSVRENVSITTSTDPQNSMQHSNRIQSSESSPRNCSNNSKSQSTVSESLNHNYHTDYTYNQQPNMHYNYHANNSHYNQPHTNHLHYETEPINDSPSSTSNSSDSIKNSSKQISNSNTTSSVETTSSIPQKIPKTSTINPLTPENPPITGLPPKGYLRGSTTRLKKVPEE